MGWWSRKRGGVGGGMVEQKEGRGRGGGWWSRKRGGVGVVSRDTAILYYNNII